MITVGVGRNIDENGGLGLSEEEIEYLLANDIKRVREELEDSYFGLRTNEARQDAMIDICFNLGLTRLRGFVKALEAMSREQFILQPMNSADSRWLLKLATEPKSPRHPQERIRNATTKDGF